MKKTLREIAAYINGEVVGDGSVVITGASGIKEASGGEITFLANPRYASFLDSTGASAIITSQEVTTAAKPIIRTADPSLAFAKVLSLFVPDQALLPKGIHPQALIAKSAKIGKDVSIGPYVVIQDEAVIEDRVVLVSGVYIGAKAVIGADSLIYPNATIRERVLIGKRNIIHSGAVIGSDGFGFATIKGEHHKIPQVGTVVIEDDVEIGSNVSIDRARFDKTVIGRGTKIDNLVHIAHNVIVGENCLIVAQAGISGSTTIGKGATIAGQAGLVGHITVGEGAIIAAQAGVTKSVAANSFVSGYPAKPHETALKVNACLQNLPKLYATVKELKNKIAELEEKLNNGKTKNHS